ncbi:MAG: 30S ribosomal protein S17 [Patescibacteria group bacterium]
MKNENKPNNTKQRRTFNGVVVSDVQDKTVVVAVKRIKKHPKYGKQYTVTRRYQVHDEKNEAKKNDEVNFMECRPLSKHKKWRLVKIKGLKDKQD